MLSCVMRISARWIYIYKDTPKDIYSSSACKQLLWATLKARGNGTSCV